MNGYLYLEKFNVQGQNYNRQFCITRFCDCVITGGQLACFHATFLFFNTIKPLS